MTRQQSNDNIDSEAALSSLRMAIEHGDGRMSKAINEFALRGPAAGLQAIRDLLGALNPLSRVELAKACRQAGVVAHERGSYETAYVWHAVANIIFTELNDRTMSAKSFHSMGLASEALGEYEKADDDYGRSATVYGELKDQPGLIENLTRRGIVCTKTGKLEEGFSWNMMALAARLAHGLPDSALDIRSLNQQRAAMGENRFRALVYGRMSDLGARNFLRLLDSQR